MSYEHESRRVEVRQDPDSLLINITDISTTPHRLQRLSALFPRLSKTFAPREVKDEKFFITFSLDTFGQDRVEKLDTIFHEGPLLKFTQVIDASVQPWRTAETHFGKFVVCNNTFYIFSQDDYTHRTAYREVVNTLNVTGKAQCAGRIDVAFSHENQQVIRRFITGYSTTLEGQLSIEESEQFKEEILELKLGSWFKIS